MLPGFAGGGFAQDRWRARERFSDSSFVREGDRNTNISAPITNIFRGVDKRTAEQLRSQQRRDIARTAARGTA